MTSRRNRLLSLHIQQQSQQHQQASSISPPHSFLTAPMSPQQPPPQPAPLSPRLSYGGAEQPFGFHKRTSIRVSQSIGLHTRLTRVSSFRSTLSPSLLSTSPVTAAFHFPKQLKTSTATFASASTAGSATPRRLVRNYSDSVLCMRRRCRRDHGSLYESSLDASVLVSATPASPSLTLFGFNRAAQFGPLAGRHSPVRLDPSLFDTLYLILSHSD
jgi:hypothetical protein